MSVEINEEALHEMFADPSGPIGQIMETKSIEVENVAKALLLIPGSGRFYDAGVMTFRHGGKVYSNYSTGGRAAGHQASRPGEPPASDTGSLLASIGHELRVEDGLVTGIIGSSKKYSIYLEKGTIWHDDDGGVHISPRPFLEPALHIVVGT